MFDVKKKVSVEVRGKRAEWGVICHMSQLQIDDMRADGCEIFEIINSTTHVGSRVRFDSPVVLRSGSVGVPKSV